MSRVVGRQSAMGVESPASARNWIEWLVPVASVVGMAVSLYLTWIHWSGSKAFCAGVGDCEAVNTSSYSEVAGVPIALLGFGMYLVLFGLSMFGWRAEPSMASNVALAVFGISLGGVLYSAYLTYVEVAVLHAVCPWCVTSAILITLIFGASLYNVMRLTSGT